MSETGKRAGEALDNDTTKRTRNVGDEDIVAGTATDPDTLTDVIFSAGVNLSEEENLLSSTLSGQHRNDRATWQQHRPGMAGMVSHDGSTMGHHGEMGMGMMGPGMGGPTAGPGAAPFVNPLFLDPVSVIKSVRKQCQESNVRNVDRDQYIVQLMSASCEEWLTSVIADALVLSRHRRRSRNDVHSSVSRALRHIAMKDKEEQDRIEAEKEKQEQEQNVGPDGKAKKQQVSEALQHRAANQTAAMMAAGSKKYSWMSSARPGVGGASAASAGGAPGAGARPGTPGASGSGSRKSDIRYREAKEEPGIVLRDLLAAIEDRRFGVEKSLTKGYLRIK